MVFPGFVQIPWHLSSPFDHTAACGTVYLGITWPGSGAWWLHSGSTCPLFFLCAGDPGLTTPKELMGEVKQKFTLQESGRTRPLLSKGTT